MSIYEAKAKLRKPSYRSNESPVYDGDTFYVDVSPWIGVSVEETVRLRGVDTHELHGDNHDRAVDERQFTANWLYKQHESSEEYPLEIRAYKYGSFGRLIADVVGEDGVLNHRLLDEFDGIEYRG